MESVGAILRRRRDELGLTLEAVAQEAGLTKGYLSMIENERLDNPPSRGALEALERALRLGRGGLMRAAEWQSTPARVRKEVERLEEENRNARELGKLLRGASRKRKDGTRDLDELLNSDDAKRLLKRAASASIDEKLPLGYSVPLINKVAAGYPTDFTDLDYPARVADEYISCPGLADPQAFAARVVGDSMLPDYKPGDVVVFSPAETIAAGADCFVRLEPDHETTFKRVFFDDGSATTSKTVRLQPLNPEFKPITVPRDRIAGMYKAVWRFQKLG